MEDTSSTVAGIPVETETHYFLALRTGDTVEDAGKGRKRSMVGSPYRQCVGSFNIGGDCGHVFDFYERPEW
jgi:hypothetical protein